MASNNLTKSELLREITKCGKDVEYFIDNYVKIQHPIRGLIPFKLYPYQKKLLQDFVDNRFNIVLKARQLGISTLIAAYCVWFMLFKRSKAILVLATKEKVSTKLVKKSNAIYKNLPDFLKISKMTVDNATSFELDNGSTIAGTATCSDAGRSEALSLLIVDEAAHIDGMEEVWTAIYPTLSTGGQCIANSSPGGAGNWFHKTWIDAEAGTNSFKGTKLLWWEHPERNDEWFAKETKNMSERDIGQELMCSFALSGETVFSPKDIEKCKLKVKEPKFKTGFDRNIWIWQEYLPGIPFCMICDSARGDGKDFGAIQIFRSDTMEQALEYQGKVPPDIFAELIYQLGREYGNCMAVVENNSVGLAVLTKLEDLKYPNIYYSTKTHQFLDPMEADLTNGAVRGFTTSMKTRPLLISKAEEYVRNGVVAIYSQRTVNEMTTFVWKNGKPEALSGYNDDLIMSMAIGCWIRDTVLVESSRETEYQKALLYGIQRSRSVFVSTIAGMPNHIETRKDIEERINYPYFLPIFKG